MSSTPIAFDGTILQGKYAFARECGSIHSVKEWVGFDGAISSIHGLSTSASPFT